MIRLSFLSLGVLIGLLSEAPAHHEPGGEERNPEQVVILIRPVESGNFTYAGSPLSAAENQDDPGYDLYKAGYRLVLEEDWSRATAAFDELLGGFPESDYHDDALYWKAYILARSNALSQAIESYQLFMESFPESPYFDDAVADLAEAEAHLELSRLDEQIERLGYLRTRKDLATSYARALSFERQLQQLARVEARGNPGIVGQSVDPGTQIRLDAVIILSEDPGDPAAAEALKDVALDRENPIILRAEAAHQLSLFDRELSFPVFVQLAKEEDDEQIRSISIENIISVPGPETVGALIDIFQTIPPEQKEAGARVFYAIADVGNEQAVDFMANIARNHADVSFRREAIYYLGAVGNDRARAALHSILRGEH